MKTTELRIGNYITTEYLNQNTFKVISIHSDRIYFESVRENFKSDTIQNYIRPIPLTEEWFMKFGFEKDNELNFVKFSFKVHFWSNYNSYMYGWIGGNIELKYVHELQNLYFALTGEDLTI